MPQILELRVYMNTRQMLKGLRENLGTAIYQLQYLDCKSEDQSVLEVAEDSLEIAQDFIDTTKQVNDISVVGEIEQDYLNYNNKGLAWLGLGIFNVAMMMCCMRAINTANTATEDFDGLAWQILRFFEYLITTCLAFEGAIQPFCLARTDFRHAKIADQQLKLLNQNSSVTFPSDIDFALAKASEYKKFRQELNENGNPLKLYRETEHAQTKLNEILNVLSQGKIKWMACIPSNSCLMLWLSHLCGQSMFSENAKSLLQFVIMAEMMVVIPALYLGKRYTIRESMFAKDVLSFIKKEHVDLSGQPVDVITRKLKF